MVTALDLVELKYKDRIDKQKLISLCDYIDEKIKEQDTLNNDFFIDIDDFNIENEKDYITYIQYLYRIVGKYSRFSIWRTWNNKYYICYEI